MESISATITDGKAIPIATILSNQIFLNSDAFCAILNKVGSRPVALVSINGPMRTGKSYILGHFMRYLSSSEKEDWFTKELSSEFHWENSAERQTSGILIWSEPFIVQRNGQEVAVLLMDTQGCFDDKTSTTENCLIFGLSFLLSSVLIYNFKGQLSEDVLQFLQQFVCFAKKPNEQFQYGTFLKLMLLIRDWTFPRAYQFGYYDDVTSKAGKNFKKDKIDVNSEMSPEVKVVHQDIISSFQTIGCCLMPYPGKGLAEEDNIHNLEPTFVDSIKEFIPKVFHGSNITTKKRGGLELTGDEMKTLVKELAKFFAENKLPTVQSPTETTAKVNNYLACQNALKYYEDAMNGANSGEGLSGEQLDNMHQKYRQESIAMFQKAKRIKHDQIQTDYQNQLCAAIDDAYSKYKDLNENLLKFNQLKVNCDLEKDQLRAEMEAQMKEIESLKQNHLEIAIPDIFKIIAESITIVENLGRVAGTAMDIVNKVQKFQKIKMNNSLGN